MVKFETAFEHAQLETLNNKSFNLVELRDIGTIVIRVQPEDVAAAQVLQVENMQLPKPLQVTGTMDSVLTMWLGPDEYLALLPRVAVDTMMTTLNTGFKGMFAHAIDNSGTFALLQLSGKKLLEVLRKHIQYDVERGFPSGKVITTHWGSAAIIVHRIDANTIVWMVRWSFADYALRLLEHAVQEYK